MSEPTITVIKPVPGYPAKTIIKSILRLVELGLLVERETELRHTRVFQIQGVNTIASLNTDFVTCRVL